MTKMNGDVLGHLFAGSEHFYYGREESLSEEFLSQADLVHTTVLRTHTSMTFKMRVYERRTFYVFTSWQMSPFVFIVDDETIERLD